MFKEKGYQQILEQEQQEAWEEYLDQTIKNAQEHENDKYMQEDPVQPYEIGGVHP